MKEIIDEKHLKVTAFKLNTTLHHCNLTNVKERTHLTLKLAFHARVKYNTKYIGKYAAGPHHQRG